MSNVFTFQGIKYSIIDQNLKTCRVGTLNSKQDTLKPNAVDKSYDLPVIIPDYVYNEAQVKFKVIEIGSEAFRFCTNITKLQLPGWVKIIRYAAFDCCFSINEIIFSEGSCLEKLETYAFSRLYALKQLVLPSSMKSIEVGAFTCLFTIEKIFYCSLVIISEDIFQNDFADEYQTPDTLKIYVSKYYESTSFGKRTNLYHIRTIANSCINIPMNTCNNNNNYLLYRLSFTYILLYNVY